MKTADVTMTEPETEHENGIVIETEERTSVIMSSHRMLGMRLVETPAVAVQDSRGTAGRTENTKMKAGMAIRIDNGMMKIALPKKNMTIVATMFARGRVGEGRKFAEVVTHVHTVLKFLNLKLLNLLNHRMYPNLNQE